MSFEINGKTYETDEEGYLLNLADWTPEAAAHLAEEVTWNHRLLDVARMREAAAHLVGSGLEGVQPHWVDRHGI